MAWLVTYPEILPAAGCVAAVGNFDGVHAGHRSLLAAAKEEAARLGMPLVVLTFEPHPRDVLKPDMPVKRLTTLQEKIELLSGAGADGVAVLPFDMTVAGWSAQKFTDEVLAGWLGARAVCVGENFRFGHKAAGDAGFLKGRNDFTTRVVPLLTDTDGVVSSSRLRSR